MTLDVSTVRSQFPALSRTVGGAPAAYLDGPGGTQVPKSVIDAMADFMRAGDSNHGGPFVTSRETDAVTESARSAIADLFGASPNEIAFGQNMTSLTLSVSRALGATWKPGDNVIVTRLDHDADVWPWVIAARDAGADVRWLNFDPDDGCRLETETVSELIDDRTRLVAMTHASNAVGTITDPGPVIEAAHAVGALTYVDAVHYSPHGLVDVAALDSGTLHGSLNRDTTKLVGRQRRQRSVKRTDRRARCTRYHDGIGISTHMFSLPGKWLDSWDPARSE